MRLCALIFAAMLCGCASTRTVTRPDGSQEVLRIGFGNAYADTTARLEPSEWVVEAGKAMGMELIRTAGDGVKARMVESVTSASVAAAG